MPSRVLQLPSAAALLIVSPPKFHEDLAMPYQPSEMKGGLPMLLVRRAVAEKLLKDAVTLIVPGVVPAVTLV